MKANDVELDTKIRRILAKRDEKVGQEASFQNKKNSP